MGNFSVSFKQRLHF